MEMELEGPYLRRVEVFNLCFDYHLIADNDSNERPGDFRGRIFVCDDCAFTEIYNSDTVDSVYVDLPNNTQEELQDYEEMQLPKTSGASTINLPLTGPNEGMIVDDYFLLVIHKDTGNRNIENQYEQEANKEYCSGGYVRPDDVRMWRSCVSSDYDTPFELDLDNDFRTLKMNCMAMKNSKVVDVHIKWCMPTSYIYGEISVFCDLFVGNKCSLIQTPQNKFVMAKEGEFIELCRFTVAIPFSSDFTVKARLHDPNNVLLVDESLRFPLVEDVKDRPYKSTLTMKGITGGCIEVVAIVYL